MMYGDYGDRVVLIDLSSNDGERFCKVALTSKEEVFCDRAECGNEEQGTILICDDCLLAQDKYDGSCLSNFNWKEIK